MKRILVTGGLGFIGSNFINYLYEVEPGVHVMNMDCFTYAAQHKFYVKRKNQTGPYTSWDCDISHVEFVNRLFQRNRIDAVVNFAAETHVDRSIEDSAPFLRTNVIGTHTLIEACRKYGVGRYVQVSTDEVYGSLGPYDEPFTEDSPIRPSNPYAASKAAADMLVLSYFRTYGFPGIVTRCSNNYGPGQHREKLIPMTISRAMKDEPIPVYGNGQNIRDWIYVEDHCRGIYEALTKGRPGEVYNFGGMAERSNRFVVSTVLAILDKPESLVQMVEDRPGHDFRYAMDYTKAYEEFGWEPRSSFLTGMWNTVDWYLEKGKVAR